MSTAVSTQVVNLARKDINAFAAYVLRDEATGGRITQGVVHRRWHAFVDSHQFAVLMAHREAGKTQQLTIVRTLFALGNNPNLRVAIVSNTTDQASKIVRVIAKYIESSQELRNVFPQLLPDPNGPWTLTKLHIKKDNTTAKDPSVVAFGVHGNIQGARFDLLILDDILDYENCMTERSRNDTWSWLQSALIGPQSANCRVLAVGTPFYRDDVLHRLAALQGYQMQKFPIKDANGQPTWPQQWPLSRIHQRESIMTPIEWNRQYMCEPRSNEDARFKREWIEVALGRGDAQVQPINAVRFTQGHMISHGIARTLPAGYNVWIGVDLGVRAKDSADPTVIFVVLEHRDHSLEVLHIESGKWHGEDIIRRVIAAGERFQATCVMVEDNSGQAFLVEQTQRRTRVPIRGFTTGRNKINPEYGVESIAGEMHRGRWIIPNIGGRMDTELAKWVQEMLDYDPKDHTGDRIMAAWLCREASRQGERKITQFNLDLHRR
jgi:hypothetical protein